VFAGSYTNDKKVVGVFVRFRAPLNSGKDEDLVTYDKSDSQQNFVSYSYRLNDGNDNGKDFEFSSNFIKNFDNEGHKLTIDGSYTKNKDNEDSTIDGVNLTFQIKLLLVQRLIVKFKNNFNFKLTMFYLQVKEVNLRLDEISIT
jgi:hypothetical protein